MSDESAPSEFGRGVVTCLAKFSAHINDRLYEHMMRQSFLANQTPHPANTMSLSLAIDTWLHAASDHFYDLDVARAPLPLVELANLTMRTGHGLSSPDELDQTTVEKVLALWKASCLALDERLGVTADWGQHT